MKAVLQYRASPGFRRQIEKKAPDWLDVVVIEEDDKKNFADEMVESNILLHVLEQVTAEVITNAPNLKLIQKIGVGINTIDLDAATANGVAICNMPGTNSRAVAEMTLMLMLSALRRLSYFDPQMRDGHGWTLDVKTFDRLGEIAGRTVGLVGYGEVARILAPILTAMGANVLYTATAPKPDAKADWRNFSNLLSEADIVSLHLPLTAKTENLFDGVAFALMKPGSVLINTSRGGLVDEAAMTDALVSGHLRAAGLDVLSIEPASSGNPLFSMSNVVVTPHIAWLTPETLDRSLGIAFENCRRIRDGEELKFRVI
tara:strand:- start:1606 stop:2550 length:945 start_codon:yes stop_codon:yes gene_type:complete